MTTAKEAIASMAIWCAQFFALYCWEALGIEGAGNLLAAWLVVILIAALINAITLDRSKPYQGGPLPRWLSRALWGAFFVMLAWFGHGWLATIHGATFSIIHVTAAAWKKADAERSLAQEAPHHG